MPETLTDLERRALDYLVEYLRTNTYQPSIREIGRTFSIKSTKTVSELLQSLADKGWIERDPSRSRGVRLLGVNLNTHAISVPIQQTMRSEALGNVDALDFDSRIAARGTFLVTMPDQGLKASGIQSGDLLLVEPVTAAQLEDGDIVLAKDGSSPIVRRFSRMPTPRLQSDDPDAPATFTGDGVTVDGRVISVVRRLRAPATVSPTPAA